MRKSSRRFSAFTLVELLVVIGIIALLISVLMPALARARASAQTIKCASNMRTLMTAHIMYAQENRGTFVPGSISIATYTWRSTTVSTAPNNHIVVPWYSELLVGRYFGQTHPIATNFGATQQRPSTLVAYCPISLNVGTHAHHIGIGYNISRENAFNKKTSNQRWRKLGTFNHVSKVIMLVDVANGGYKENWGNGLGGSYFWARYYYGTGGYPVSGNDDNPPTGYIAYRHNNAANVAFADGHVEPFKLTNNDATTGGLQAAYEKKLVTHRADLP